MSYIRFGLMIAVSTLVMFVLMYFNTYEFAHLRFSETRTWMALVMGAAMAIVMLGFMWSMYENRALNLAIVAGAALCFAVALFVVRSQATVDDIDYMKAMIPHHSIAVMTSERARIHDPRVRKLADQILQTQIREIAEMEGLIADLQRNPVPQGAPELPATR
jgi:uncharacterized protein (DUF305 family)